MQAGKRVNPIDVDVGRRIRIRRIQLELSQTFVADKLGITFQQVQKYEKGTNRVSASRLQNIAELLDVPVSFFFGDSGGQSAQGDKVLDFLENAYGIRLIKAFAQIKNRGLQISLVDLVEKLTQPETDEKSAKPKTD